MGRLPCFVSQPTTAVQWASGASWNQPSTWTRLAVATTVASWPTKSTSVAVRQVSVQGPVKQNPGVNRQPGRSNVSTAEHCHGGAGGWTVGVHALVYMCVHTYMCLYKQWVPTRGLSALGGSCARLSTTIIPTPIARQLPMGGVWPFVTQQ